MSEADLAFLDERQEVIEGIPVAAYLRPRSQGGQPLGEEGQLAQHEAVGAFYPIGEPEGDVLGRSLPYVLDDEAYVGEVGVVLGDRDERPPSARGVLGAHLLNRGPGGPYGEVVAEPYDRDEDGLQDGRGDLGDGQKVHGAS
jgi:hypothetical protein